MDEKASSSGNGGDSPTDAPSSPPELIDPPSLDDAVDNKANDDDDDAEKKVANSDDSNDDDKSSATMTPDDLLLKAMTHKEDGNSHFKSSDYTSATRSYRRGTNALKTLNIDNSGDEQVKSLLITLQTNLSMVCYKQSKHKMSRDVASKALEIDSINVKALYRRAVAHRALGDADAAKADLRTALKTEPNNVSVRKELISIKKLVENQKAKEKARLQKAFSKGGSSLLYSDKEEEEQRKLMEVEEKKKLEKEAVQKRKGEWEDEVVRRMASDPPQEAISFDEWDKQRRKKEEDAEKAQKKAKKAIADVEREAQRKAREAQKAANNTNNNNESDDDDDDDDKLTERELAMLRGYKKTSDGRTTSYFNREQTEHEKQLIGSIQPKKLDEVSSPTASSSGVGGPSAWNASGTTWEEKDTTDWCKKTLEQSLLDTTSAYYSATSSDGGTTYVAVVKKVTDLTGDASVAIAGGKKRYIYDFHANVEYEVTGEDGEAIASGSLRMPEIHSANSNEDELDVDVIAWKTPPPADSGVSVMQDCVECRKVLVADVRKSVLRFVEKFNATF
eukprot:CAMPEP_0172307430 /NCGR_PEP_ID=MMETSP1058-20130122/8295_1 /TAXON_ID=83371 /ORGANISM="Detonula confervacea, Strain CCMP 353" /LENGTH=560 /DNA_ID=CAMNT_0013019597 /DNA_START=12 /DNA_END=1694 /DNA_ORIENTATION=+